MNRPSLPLFMAFVVMGALWFYTSTARGFEEVDGGYKMSLRDMQDLQNLQHVLRVLQGQNKVLRGKLEEANARYKTLENQCI